MDANDFGIKLAGLRKGKGLSQKELALKLAVSNKTVSKWECGRSLPDLSFIPRLSAIFDVSADELLGIIPNEEKKESENEKESRLQQSPSRRALYEKKIAVWEWTLLLAFCVAPFLISVFFYMFLPLKIPMHYDYAGNVTRWGKNYEIIFLGILYSAIPSFLPFFIRYLKTKKANPVKNEWRIVLWAMITISAMYSVITIWYCIKARTDALSAGGASVSPDIGKLALLIVNALILISGTVLPILKQNRYFGIRTGATLADEELWYKTHEAGGAVFAAVGLAGALICALTNGVVFSFVYTLFVEPAIIFIILYCVKKAKRKEE